LSRSSDLVAQERELRTKLEEHEIAPEEERARLQELEVQLDQCWDLLRQWRAKRQYGENPDEASARPEQEVENYLQ